MKQKVDFELLAQWLDPDIEQLLADVAREPFSVGLNKAVDAECEAINTLMMLKDETGIRLIAMDAHSPGYFLVTELCVAYLKHRGYADVCVWERKNGNAKR